MQANTALHFISCNQHHKTSSRDVEATLVPFNATSWSFYTLV